VPIKELVKLMPITLVDVPLNALVRYPAKVPTFPI